MQGSTVDASIHTLENLYDIKLQLLCSSQFHVLPQVDWPSRGIIGRMTRNSRACAGVHFPSWKVIWIQSKHSVFGDATHSKVSNDRGKNQRKKSLQPLSKSWPLLRSWVTIGLSEPQIPSNQYAVASYSELDQYQLETGGFIGWPLKGQRTCDLPSWLPCLDLISCCGVGSSPSLTRLWNHSKSDGRKRKMIDIHSHMSLMDDGPKTRRYAYLILEESYRQGYGPLSPLLIVAGDVWNSTKIFKGEKLRRGRARFDDSLRGRSLLY